MSVIAGAEREALTDRLARMVWARVAEPGTKRVTGWIAEHGPCGALVKLSEGELPGAGAHRDRLAGIDVTVDRRHAELIEARIVIPGDGEWPRGLDDLSDPPLCLWVRGGRDLAESCRRSVAIVGARNATPYGLDVSGDLAAGLCDRGFTVVSGAAYGIDSAAHRGALAVDGTTVAVLACGVDRDYPAAHGSLLAEIRRTGSVVSEIPLGHAPLRSRFIERNRLIAALTSGTVVVEAGVRSGSLNTLRHALAIGRPTGAVPGPVTSVVSAGSNQALRDHRAEVVTDAAEVAELVGRIGADLAPEQHGVTRPEDRLSDDERALWERLPMRRPMPVDRLAEYALLDIDGARASLGLLEARGLAERCLDGWRRSRRAPAHS